MSPNIPDSKCYLTTGAIPASASDVEKRRPFKTLVDHVFQYQVDLILPDEIYQVIQDDLFSKIGDVQYHRIFMPLGGILEKDFYTKYIRMGNVIMLSDGRIDVDDVFCLYDGILHLCVTKETYEKAGLVGGKATFGGRNKERWIIEFNLRQSFMVHGRPAFDRLRWSCENVFKTNQRWLFCDLNQKAVNPKSHDEDDKAKLTGLSAPTLLRTSTPTVRSSNSPIKIPSLEPPSFPQALQTKLDSEFRRDTFLDWAMHVHEWLAFASIFADRLPVTDKVDAYLSRYEVEGASGKTARKVTRIRWKGFLPSQWTKELLRTVSSLTPRNEWSSVTVYGFANAPISWRGEQHSAVAGGFGGENIVTVMVMPGDVPGPEQMISNHESQKRAKPKDNSTSRDAMDVDASGDEPNLADPPDQKQHFMMWEVVGGRDEHS